MGASSSDGEGRAARASEPAAGGPAANGTPQACPSEPSSSKADSGSTANTAAPDGAQKKIVEDSVQAGVTSGIRARYEQAQKELFSEYLRALGEAMGQVSVDGNIEEANEESSDDESPAAESQMERVIKQFSLKVEENMRAMQKNMPQWTPPQPPYNAYMQQQQRMLRRRVPLPPQDVEDRNDEDDPKTLSAPRGSVLEFKRLDELYDKTVHDFRLRETSKKGIGKEEKYAAYVAIVRRRFGMVPTPDGMGMLPPDPDIRQLGPRLIDSDWQNKYQRTFVDLKSPELVKVAREVFKNVPFIAGLREDKVSLDPNMLFNYLADFEDHLGKAKSEPEDKQDKKLIDHLKLLIDYVKTDYEATESRLYPMLAAHEITFDLLWALFLPNTLVYTVCPGSGEPRCLKLDWGEMKEDMQRGRYFHLDCHYVDFDGKTFGETNGCVEIDEFRGARPITDIGVYPLAYHTDAEGMRTKLMDRGRKFGALKGQQYKFYKGIAFFRKKRGLVKVSVNGRVMIDSATFRRINPSYRTNPVKGNAKLYSATAIRNDEGDSENEDGGCDDGEDEDEEINSIPASSGTTAKPSSSLSVSRKPQRSYIISPDGKMKLVHNDSKVMEKLLDAKKAMQKRAAKEGEDDVEDDRNVQAETMTDEMLLLCSPTLLGYSFNDKIWAEFAVAHCEDIVFNPDAFDSLVIPEERKRIVKALVESHAGKGSGKTGIDDIIKGKGRGMVVVLHGKPGVGKTLTAEGISEYLRRPLYMVSAGELGTDPARLELQLSRILDVASAWGAILLLDEADVFLERRSVHDLHRNALVSVFLRLLEYFQGILFLTTNRVDTFDEAFQSRVHVALPYSDLDRKARKIIWGMFLGMVAREEAADAAKMKQMGNSAENGNGQKDSKADTPAPLHKVVDEEDMNALARKDLNGRQIKNIVRTAQALAANHGERLAMRHLKLVLDVTEGFEHDLKGTGQLEGMMSYA